MMKKFLLALVIIISFVSCSFAYSGGTGSKNYPYLISTENDLVEFRNRVNNASDDQGSYYLISTDAVGFQMTKYNTWTPVGKGNAFKGHLDGNGKIIYVNMSNNTSKDRVAFFDTIGSGASVDKLYIEGSVKSNTDAAGFALTLSGGTLTNCRFSGQIYVDDYIPDEPTENLNAAGLVEYISSGTIENCTFNGEIKIDGGIYPRAGGITALMHGGSIKDCDVSHYSIIESYATEVDTSTSAIAGGIAGQVNIGLSETIEGCDFSGKVTAESSGTSYAGGIVGYMRGGTLKDNTVRDDSVISGAYTAGGIVGFLRTGGTVENNTVEAGAAVTAESYSAGGIIGILDLGTVTNNTSHATISGNASYKGGIIGQVTPATESPATRTISNNEYSGADYGIGSDSSGSPSNSGTDETVSPFYITTSSALESGVIYEAYSQSFATNMSSDLASWQRTSGNFPSGLSLSGNTLSGTPTATGTFEFTLMASVYNSANNSYRTAEKTFSLTIDAHLNITTSSALENGTAGRTYGPVTLETDAEDGAYVTWTASGLPAGLTLGNLTGILSGTPTTAGYYSFTVTAASGAYTATKTFTITINPSLTITTDSELPSALVNSAYSVTLSSSASDTENVTWSHISGTLPTGLDLSNGGTISGTPTVSGTFNFVIQASIENTSYTDSKDFELTVDPVITITTSTLASGKAGTSYSQELSASPTGLSYTWSVLNGDFPSGLTLDSSAGTITGIPTTAGTYTFTVRALSGSLYADKILTLTIEPAFSITTESSDLDYAKMNQYYSFDLETDAEDTVTVIWSVTSGSLPNGMYLASYTGRIYGTPTAAGYYTFTVRAAAGGLTAEKTFSLTVIPSLSIITSSPLPSGVINQVYSQDIETDAESGNAVTWSLVSGSLPGGITFNTSTGRLYGTPTSAGTYSFTIGAKTGSYTAENKIFTLSILPSLTITTSSELTNAKVSQSYSADISAALISGATYTWSLTDGTLPDGLTLSSSTTSTITLSGTPTTEGTYTFTLQVSAAGMTASGTFTLTVDPLMTITTEALPDGKMNQYYSFDIETDAEDSASVLWSVTGGSLPNGMYLASYTGRIYGTPTAAGYYTFTVRAAAGGVTAEKTFGLTIRPSLSITTSSPLPAGVINQLYSQDIQTDAEAGNAVQWSFVSGDLPGGITFNTSTGRLYGTPTSTGTYSFTIGAKTGSYTAENKIFTLSILPSLTITTSSELTNAKVSQSYSADISAASISGATYTWSLTDGTLPDGLTLSSSTTSTITLSGTPTTEGTYTFTLQVSATGMTASKIFTLTVDPPMTITTDTLPDGKMNEAYSASLKAELESSAFVMWSVVGGALPEGLSLGSYTGVITGTPTRAGYFVFTVRASAGSMYAEKGLGIIITPSLIITTSENLTDGIVNVPYSQTISCDAGTGNVVTWALISGFLPEGLNFDSSTGVISGAPTETGTFKFTIRASTGTLTASKEFTITVMPELYIITDSILPSVKVLHDYSVTLNASSVSGNILTWSIVSNDLPSGLTLNSSTGTISGTPTREGTYTFTVQAAANGQTARKEFTLEVRPSLYITTTSPLPTVKEGSRYEVQLLTDIDSDMAVTWSVISGDLPSGLTLRENTGVISGIPDTEGTYVFVIHAKAGLLESSKTFILTVKPALSITTESELPEARPNDLYSLKFETDADSFDVVEWQFVSGDLPEGFAFNAQTGTLSGSSSEKGIYEFTIGANVRTSLRNLSARKIFVLRLSPAMIITNNDSYRIDAGSSFSLNLEAMITDTSSIESSIWSVISGDIPYGLKLDEDGTLSGIPVKAGTFRFTLQAISGYSRARKDFIFKINLAVSSPSYLTDGIKGESYSELLKAEGSNNIIWSVVRGSTLPSGLTLSTAGLIQGVPAAEGIYDFTVNASDDNGHGARKLLRITIGSVSILPVTTAVLPEGKAGEAYYAVLYSSVSNAKWEITEGSLPNGLTLNSSNGVIEGIPSESGTFTFTVKASYASRTGTKRLTLIIYPADEEPEEPSGISSSGGGCNTGINSIILIASLSLIFRRRY